MKLTDLKKSVNSVLKNVFPLISRKSNDTVEGFDKPTFFTQIIPVVSQNETVNYSSNKVLVIINYFNGDLGEVDNLEMYDEIKRAFVMTLKVNERSFLIRNFVSSTIDGVLQTKFDLDYLVTTDKKRNTGDMTDYDLMREIHLDLKRR